MWTYYRDETMQYNLSTDAAARIVNDETRQREIMHRYGRLVIQCPTYMLIGPAMMSKSDALQMLRDAGATI